MNNKITQLEGEIKQANLAYASGYPLMSDEEYHETLWKPLYQLDPGNKNLYHTSNNPNLAENIKPHSRPIKGIRKAFEAKELIPFLNRFKDKLLQIEPKYDGVAIVKYTMPDNRFKLLLSGDGLSGRDISNFIPKILFPSDTYSTESMELMIAGSDWSKALGDNVRTTVSGYLASSPKAIPENLDLCAVSHYQPQLLRKIQGSYLLNLTDEAKTEYLLTLFNEWKKLYVLDGLVLKVADQNLRTAIDAHETYYDYAIAWKPPIEVKETTVTDIEWNVSRSGRIIPTVIYRPLELKGTMNTRVTGNNANWILRHGIAPGAKVMIGKAGEIIPKIVEVTMPMKTKSPIQCPYCGGEIRFQGENIFCDNPNCFPQIAKKIEYFYSKFGMDLKTIGYYRVIQLLEKSPQLYLKIKDDYWKLLAPYQYGLSSLITKIWGDKITKNYLDSLEQIKGKKNLIDFITGLGLDKLGRRITTTLYFYLKGQPLHRAINQTAVTNFTLGYTKFLKAQEELKGEFTFAEPPIPPKLVYCITGTLSNGSRSDMVEYLNKYNFMFINHVTQRTAFLLVGEKAGKAKLQKAKELGIPVKNEDDLIEIIKKEKENHE